MKNKMMNSALGRGWLVLGACVLLGGAALAAADPWAELPAGQRPAPGTPVLDGAWLITRPVAELKTIDGKAPPLLPAAKAEYDKRKAALKADPKTDPVTNCWMHGLPRLLYAPYPVLIAQDKDRINFVHEVNHTFRVVSLTRKLPNPADEDPTWNGYSVGRWEGKALVIDTVGFNDKTWLDYSGLPHGTKLKVQERYTLKTPTTLEGVVTITDPDTYSAPWSTKFTWVKQANYQPKEMVCVSDHKM